MGTIAERFIPPKMHRKEPLFIVAELKGISFSMSASALRLSIDNFFGYCDTYGAAQEKIALDAVESVLNSCGMVEYSARYDDEGRFLVIARDASKTASNLKGEIDSIYLLKHDPNSSAVTRSYDGKRVKLNPEKITASFEIYESSLEEAVEKILYSR